MTQFIEGLLLGFGFSIGCIIVIYTTIWLEDNFSKDELL